MADQPDPLDSPNPMDSDPYLRAFVEGQEPQADEDPQEVVQRVRQRLEASGFQVRFEQEPEKKATTVLLSKEGRQESATSSSMLTAIREVLRRLIR